MTSYDQVASGKRDVEHLAKQIVNRKNKDNGDNVLRIGFFTLK